MNKKMTFDRWDGHHTAEIGDDILTVVGCILVRTNKRGKVKTVTKFKDEQEAVLWTERHCL